MAIALLDQQRLFAAAYVLGHGNATQAAIKAGYSPVSARQDSITAVAYPARPGRHQAGARARAEGAAGEQGGIATVTNPDWGLAS